MSIQASIDAITKFVRKSRQEKELMMARSKAYILSRLAS
jgi:hypothetical protein